MNISSISQNYTLERIKLNKLLYESNSIFINKYLSDQKRDLKIDTIKNIRNLSYSSQEAEKLFYRYVVREYEKSKENFQIDTTSTLQSLKIGDFSKARQILLDRYLLAIECLSK